MVSQARPYIVPFLRSELHPNQRQPGTRGLIIPLLYLATTEVRHRLSQLDSLGLLPTAVRRLLIDESIPGASVTLVPDLTARDFLKLLETPTKESLDYWILQGERSVWPAVGAMKVRCAIEVELDRCYQLVRRRKPLDATSPMMIHSEFNASATKRRRRAVSLGQG